MMEAVSTSERRLISAGLHGAKSQNTVIFKLILYLHPLFLYLITTMLEEFFPTAKGIYFIILIDSHDACMDIL
jgi:hypothetical protein